MKNPSRWLPISAALGLSLAGCGKKTEVKATASELEKAFPTASAPVSAQPQNAAPTPASPISANEFVNQAVTAARANDYAGSVIALTAAQQDPGVTAEQVMAVQRAKQALVENLQERAIRGDQTAIAQLKAIERTRSQ